MIRKDKKQWLCLLAFAGSVGWVALFYSILQHLNDVRTTTYQVHAIGAIMLCAFMPMALGLALGLLGRRRLYITPAYLLTALLCLLPGLLYIGTLLSWPLFPGDLLWMPRFMMNMQPSAWLPWCGFATGFLLIRGLLAPSLPPNTKNSLQDPLDK